MGYMSRFAIVVSGPYADQLGMARLKAIGAMGQTDQLISQIVEGFENGESAFFIGPSGAKQGSFELNFDLARRTDFLLALQEFKGQGNVIHWAEIIFGSEDTRGDPARMLSSSDDPIPAGLPPTPERRLRSAIEHAINSASAEKGSNTPDFILAEYLTDALAAFDAAVTAREKWYGRAPQPVPGPTQI